MPYRFVRITDYYPQYLDYFYYRHAALKELSYSDYYGLITNDSFETASCYTRHLREAGVEAYDIISNARHLQNAWIRENNLLPNIDRKELIIHQLNHYKPDVVWVDDFSLVDNNWKNEMLKAVPSVKLFVSHICAPYNAPLEAKFRLFDIMFTCTPCFKSDLEKGGLNTFLIYHGFDTSVLKQLNQSNSFPETELLFSGSLYTGSKFHQSRIDYLERMLAAGIEIDLYSNLEPRIKTMIKKTAYYTAKAIRKMNLDKLADSIPAMKNIQGYENPVRGYSKTLRQNSSNPVFGIDMYQLLYKTKICFNIHGEVAGNCAGNIRMFEATGVGACLLTDWKENIRHLFEPDIEIVTYKSADECIEKAKWLLDNADEREKIAKAGQERTLKCHTIKHRVELVHEIIKKELKKN